MKNILYILLLIFSNYFYSQKANLSIHSKVIIKEENPKYPYSGPGFSGFEDSLSYCYSPLNDKEKNKLIKELSYHVKNKTTKFTYGGGPDNDLGYREYVPNTNIRFHKTNDNNHFITNPNYDLEGEDWYENDSLILEEKWSALDETDIPLYDSLGDPIFEVRKYKEPFIQHLFSINNLENWKYHLNSFDKSSVLASLELFIFDPSGWRHEIGRSYTAILSNKNRKSLTLLKKGVTYNQLLFPYYSLGHHYVDKLAKNSDHKNSIEAASAQIEIKNYNSIFLNKQTAQIFLRQILEDIY